MKKTDIFIITGLIISLLIFLTFSLQNVGQQNTNILKNQEAIQEGINASRQNTVLILEALNTSRQNTELLLENQQIIINLSNTTGQLTERLEFIENALRQYDPSIILQSQPTN